MQGCSKANLHRRLHHTLAQPRAAPGRLKKILVAAVIGEPDHLLKPMHWRIKRAIEQRFVLPKEYLACTAL
jgi:hypothetical protein